MKILVLNSGSSSIKYQLFNMDTQTVLASGLVERIGEEKALLKQGDIKIERPLKNHKEGLDLVIHTLTDAQKGVIKNTKEIEAVGHRVVHGGEKFSHSTIIDNSVLQAIKDNVVLAPLHNPANITGIETAQELFPGVPQVAVFDTAFHQTMPKHSYLYAIPMDLYKKHHIRRYGFHGTSHYYVAKTAAKTLGIPFEKANIVTLHLGNGASACAIENGKSIDTSMGLTPLEGLMMGTRSGDMDPAIINFLANNAGMSIKDIDNMLNKQSGVKGLFGSNDLRDLENAHVEKNELATTVLTAYCYRIKKYLGAYMAALPRVDAIVFTAGVGENSDIIRELVCNNLSHLGVEIDPELNRPRSKQPRVVSKTSSKVKIMVVPTNEELEIANQTLALLRK